MGAALTGSPWNLANSSRVSIPASLCKAETMPKEAMAAKMKEMERTETMIKRGGGVEREEEGRG